MSLRRAARKFTKTLDSTAIVNGTVDNFGINGTLAGLTNGAQYDVTIDRVDSNGTLTASKEEVLTCTVSGDRFISCTRGVEGTAQAHSAGAVLEVRLTASQWNGVIDELTITKTNPLYLGIANLLFPVGTVYGNGAVTTNPGTLLGFGTWVAIAGKVVVGYDSTQTEFDALGKTGGEKTHLLTGAESGEKGHGHSDSGHTHTVAESQTILGGSGSDWNHAGGGVNRGIAHVTVNTGYANIQAVGASSASSAHNNLQPYEVSALWRRTA